MKNQHDASVPDPETPEEILGSVIRARRLELGLGAKDFVWEGKPPDLNLQEIESGTCRICLHDLLHLARLLETTSADLLERVEKRLARGFE